MPKERPSRQPPLRIGHRGAAGHAPENTLKSIRTAIGFGVDQVEVDLRASRDGHLVVIHDETVDRTTSGKGKVADLPLAELTTLDAGCGQRIPTLDEVLELAQGRVGLMLELKVSGMAVQTVEMVRQRRFTGAVIYASFLLHELILVRQTDADAKTLALFDEIPQDAVAQALTVHASHVGLNYKTATAQAMMAFHRAGLQIFVYTVNEPQDVLAMRPLGVDGIISDFPDRV